jgi:hypothetical protein
VSYNGYANYETWAVSLWLDNDEGHYGYIREHAAEVREEHEHDNPNVLSRDAAGELADWLKDYVGELPEIEGVTDEASLASDLLGAALSEVDWQEIAEGILSE